MCYQVSSEGRNSTFDNGHQKGQGVIVLFYDASLHPAEYFIDIADCSGLDTWDGLMKVGLYAESKWIRLLLRKRLLIWVGYAAVLVGLGSGVAVIAITKKGKFFW